jgi:hypothetical protein
MSPLSREAIFAVLSGLSVLACDKSTVPSAEPASSVAKAAVAPELSAREVPSATGKPAPSAGKEQSCAPGGCAPGQCGAGK